MAYGLVTCIILDAFVSSLIRLMIPNVQLQRSFCIQLGQVLAYVDCKAWRPVVYISGGFCHSCHYSDFHADKLTSAQERNPSCV